MTSTPSTEVARRAGGRGRADPPDRIDDGQTDAAALDADFTAFVAANGAKLLRLAELMTGDPHRAADLTQTALERAYLRWRSIDSDPLAYVRRIIVNSYRDWWRLRRNRERPTDQPPDRPIPYDLADRQAQEAVVRQALHALTRRERQVVVLRYYADLSEAAIAQELRIAPGTVKSTLSRALGRLRGLPALAEHKNS
ncbi:SigE family RNA polymerase sigma factor [Catenulispora yoronensis]|uniref:SigE family RNA polymerase sigma factor n=1 Tax=Catenulispora yoronensis TaxID=450799 RepID=UPI0031D46FD6